MKYKKLFIYILTVGILCLLINLILNLELIITFGILCFILFLCHLIKSLASIRLNEIRKAKLNLLFSFSYLILYLKIYYTYYNILFSILLIVIYTVLLIKRNHPKNYFYKFLFNTLLVLNILIFITPNKYILIFHSNEHILWRSNISWDEFNSKNIDTTDTGAEIFTYFGGYPNKVYNYPQGVVFSTMSVSKSWKNENEKVNLNSFLLNHEQKHFDITQIFTTKAQDSINKVFGKSSKEIEDIVNYFIEEEDKFQDKYDSLTEHGTNINAQKKYNKKISKLLKNDT